MAPPPKTSADLQQAATTARRGFRIYTPESQREDVLGKSMPLPFRPENKSLFGIKTSGGQRVKGTTSTHKKRIARAVLHRHRECGVFPLRCGAALGNPDPKKMGKKEFTKDFLV